MQARMVKCLYFSIKMFYSQTATRDHIQNEPPLKTTEIHIYVNRGKPVNAPRNPSLTV